MRQINENSRKWPNNCKKCPKLVKNCQKLAKKIHQYYSPFSDENDSGDFIVISTVIQILFLSIRVDTPAQLAFSILDGMFARFSRHSLKILWRRAR